MNLALTDDEAAALTRHLRSAIEGDRYPLSPRLAPLKAILAKFDPRPTSAMNAYNGSPMTLGNAAAAHVRFVVWCLDCAHQVEPDPAEIAERHGADMTALAWRSRLVCGRCGSRRVDMVVSGTDRRS